MTIKVIVDRWKSEEGKKKASIIVESLLKNTPFSNIPNLELYQGKWDLRGINLSLKTHERVLKTVTGSLKQKFGTLQFHGVNFDQVDFSYSNISNIILDRCKITNCVFKETTAKEIRVIATNFHDCIFQETNLSRSFLNQNIGINSGSFTNIQFIGANLSKSIFYFPDIRNCQFINCNLFETDFDGSRFENCEFIGTIDSVFFRGKSIHFRTHFWNLFAKIPSNKMVDIDFSQAELIGVSFTDSINLSLCKFPKDGNHLLVKDLKITYARVKEIINKEWHGSEKQKGIAFIEKVLYPENRLNQLYDLVDKHLLSDNGKDLLGLKLFELIKQVSNELKLEK